MAQNIELFYSYWIPFKKQQSKILYLDRRHICNTNIQAEAYAILEGVQKAVSLGIKKLIIKGDNLLIIKS